MPTEYHQIRHIRLPVLVKVPRWGDSPSRKQDQKVTRIDLPILVEIGVKHLTHRCGQSERGFKGRRTG